MNFNFPFLYMLFVGLAAVSIISALGFLNYASATDVNMSENMNMSGNMNAGGNMSKNMNENMSTNENMNTNGNMSGTMNKILPPLQQFKSGVSANNVQCQAGFTLIIKIEDGSPACVNSQDAQALIVRGWGTAS